MKGGLPTRKELTKGQNVRAVGSLWSEWGNVSTYPGAGFISGDYYWTSELSSYNGYPYIVFSSDGDVRDHRDDTYPNHVVRRQDL